MIRSFLFLLVLLAPFALLPNAAHAACLYDTECPVGQICQIGAFEGVCIPGSRATPTVAPTCGGATCVTPQICCVADGFPDPFCAAQATCDSMQGADNQSNTVDTPKAGSASNDHSTGNSGVALVNPLKVDSVPEFLALILKAVVNLGSIILVLMLVYVGFLFVVAQGNEEKLQNAKSALLWTVVGGLVLLGAQAISLVIQATVGSLQ